MTITADATPVPAEGQAELARWQAFATRARAARDAAPKTDYPTRTLSCDCGRPGRGDVPADGAVPAHHCRQCGPSCCLIREHLLARALTSA